MTTARELGDFGGVVTVDGGNVGLGVTPAAWASGYRALQINTTGALNANSVAVVMSNNYRYDGTDFRYLTTAPASDYFQYNGIHTWRYAASGTAGAVATMTTGMTMDASGNLQFNSGYGSVATAYGCRAWVNFNGTGTVAIRASGNVSSITDNGVGTYAVNFTNAMPDANYCVQASSFVSTAANTVNNVSSITASAANIVHAENNAPADTASMYVAIFR